MAGILKGLEDKIAARVKKEVGVLVPLLEKMVALLKQIEKNTRKS